VSQNRNTKISRPQSNSYVSVFAWYRPLFSSQSPYSGTMCWNPFLGFLPWVRQLRFAFVTLASWRRQVKALCSLLRRRSALKTMRTGYVGGHIAASYVTQASPFASVITVTGLAAGRANNWGSILGVGKKFFPPQKHPDWQWGPPKVLTNGGLAREASESPTFTQQRFKKAWSYTSAFPYAFKACCLLSSGIALPSLTIYSHIFALQAATTFDF